MYPEINCILEGHSSPVTCMAFSPDGLSLVSGTEDGELTLWDIIIGKRIREPIRENYYPHDSPYTSVAFSPDGLRFVSGTYEHGISSITLWDVSTGTSIRKFLGGHKGAACSLAFSPDGSKIASGNHLNCINIWNVYGDNSIDKIIEGDQAEGWVRYIEFSPDGNQLISKSYDYIKSLSTINFWDVNTGEKVKEPIQENYKLANTIAFSHNNSKIAFAQESTIYIVI